MKNKFKLCSRLFAIATAMGCILIAPLSAFALVIDRAALVIEVQSDALCRADNPSLEKAFIKAFENLEISRVNRQDAPMTVRVSVLNGSINDRTNMCLMMYSVNFEVPVTYTYPGTTNTFNIIGTFCSREGWRVEKSWMQDVENRIVGNFESCVTEIHKMKKIK